MCPAPEFLRGNFQVKKAVQEQAHSQPADAAQKLRNELREQVLSSLGGSMVYVERTDLTWDGDDAGD